MRVVPAAQIAELDRRATEEYGIPISRLMDGAGRRVAQAAEEILGVQGGRRILVLAGKGNNGGGGVVPAGDIAPGGVDGRAAVAWAAGGGRREPAAWADAARHPGVGAALDT